MEEQQANPIEPPRGIYTTRVDDKGRLKLPKDFEEFLKRFAEQTFFVTTLDGNIVRIYPMSVWRQNEKFFEEAQEQAEAAEELNFWANVWGAVSPLDGQGRILIPPDLRRELKVENQPVRVGVFKGAVEVYSEAVFNERKQRAGVRLSDKVAALRQKGFK